MAAYGVTEYWCSKSFDPSDKFGTDYVFYIEIDENNTNRKQVFHQISYVSMINVKML